MGKITLHTPMHSSDRTTTTDYEANNIINIKSVVGNDNREGTEFYIDGIIKRQYCIENANTLKRLIEENRTENKDFSIGSLHIGDQVNQNGIMFWFKDMKFRIGMIIGFVIGTTLSWIFNFIW